jgi:integrase
MALTQFQIQQLINGFIHECLDYEEQNRLNYKQVYDGKGGMPDIPEEHLTIVDDFTDDAMAQLKKGDYSKVAKVADHILEANNLEVDPAGMDYKALCRETLKAQIKLLQIEKNRNKGDYSDVLPPRPETVNQAVSPVPESSPVVPPVGPSFKALTREWLDEGINADLWKRRTITSYEGHIRVLTQIIGADIPVSSFDHPRVKAIKDTLLKLPSGMNKKKVFQEKSVAEIIEINKTEGFPTISVKTTNNYIETLGNFFKWCVGNGYMEMDYASGKRVKTRKVDPASLRDIFTPDDLKRLFHSPGYKDDIFQKPYRFWLPVLGLYTGARLNELCQLRLDDIQTIDGIYAFVLNEEEDGVDVLKDKTISVKSASGQRQVPIHPFVVNDLNLKGYVDYMKSTGETRLFPELPFQNENYGHEASKWFGTYRKAQGVGSAKKVFHCFRHTLTDNLKQQLIPENLADELTGHVSTGISYGRYGKAYTLEVLYNEGILKLDYDVDLTHLKKSQWTKYEK